MVREKREEIVILINQLYSNARYAKELKLPIIKELLTDAADTLVTLVPKG